MNKQFIKSIIVWGFIMWLIGYIMGILLYAVVPASMIGWIITPFGIAISLWALLKKVSFSTKEQAIFIGIIWATIAIVCDYFFLVKVFNPIDGYYKLDVYLYYLITFALPIIVGRLKNHK